jgi:hypothetical protein
MNADVDFEKFTHRNSRNKERRHYKPGIIFEGTDGFIGDFGSPSKIIEFVNKRYGIRSYKDGASKRTFSIKERKTDKIIGFAFIAEHTKGEYA